MPTLQKPEDTLMSYLPGIAAPAVLSAVLILGSKNRRLTMAWTRPTLREICVGLEINGYFTARI
jgi:coenzyme PQQ precursor peptide PqqA